MAAAPLWQLLCVAAGLLMASLPSAGALQCYKGLRTPKTPVSDAETAVSASEIVVSKSEMVASASKTVVSASEHENTQAQKKV